MIGFQFSVFMEKGLSCPGKDTQKKTIRCETRVFYDFASDFFGLVKKSSVNPSAFTQRGRLFVSRQSDPILLAFFQKRKTEN